MACAEFETRILEYFEGALTDEDWSAVERHVSVCGACRAFMEEQGDIEEHLTARLAPPSPSAAFRQRVLRAVDSEASRPKVSYLPEVLDLIGCAGVAAAGGLLLERILPLAVGWSPNAGPLAAWTIGAIFLGAGFWIALRSATSPLPPLE